VWFLIISVNKQDPEVYQFVRNVVWDSGREDLPAPVESHWIGLDCCKAVIDDCLSSVSRQVYPLQWLNYTAGNSERVRWAVVTPRHNCVIGYAADQWRYLTHSWCRCCWVTVNRHRQKGLWVTRPHIGRHR